MSRRQPKPPPMLDGFTAGRLIGVGGYADVYLYEQHRPAREVAVKVLAVDVLHDDSQRRRFTTEADLMARVSRHPYIVPVFQADIARDGRPYIVMEYYPGANFLERVRREQFSVADVLRVGINIASAVETAHRAGILHRDLKPANILTSEFGRPGLTDFGIAAPDDQQNDEADGLSIPWAPPEAFGADRLDERADVYSLAATVYHLLAARSPFEISGVSSTPLELIARIERLPVPPIG
ncbi:MAG TPA: serine/threonine-protein kinase, partial [Ilumatobacteraceae bacterium]|nr:serine/threonine-protein kinase [Ilumatobacteraceae bacterium]